MRKTGLCSLCLIFVLLGSGFVDCMAGTLDPTSNTSAVTREEVMAEGNELGEEGDRKSGKQTVAAPAKVCRAAGGQFANSFPVPDFGEPVNQVITSIALNTKLVKTGDQLEVRIVKNGRGLRPSELKKRTTAFVVTKASGFGHILLFSGDTIRVQVFPNEKLSIQDPFIRNFAKQACVKIRPERLPES